MKHIAFIITILISVAANSQDTENIYRDFSYQLRKLPVDYECIDKAVALFDSETTNLESSVSDSLFSILFRFIVRKENDLNDLLYEEEYIDDYGSLIWADTKMHKENAVNFENRLNKVNIRISSTEGFIYLMYDFSKNEDLLKAKLSTHSQDLLDMLIQERDFPSAEDGGLIISLFEVVDRLVKWENQLSTYKYPMIDIKKDLYNYYLSVLIYGLDNTPITYGRPEFEKHFIDSYKYMIEKYPENKSTMIVKRYYQLIESNDFKMNDEISNFKY